MRFRLLRASILLESYIFDLGSWVVRQCNCSFELVLVSSFASILKSPIFQLLVRFHDFGRLCRPILSHRVQRVLIVVSVPAELAVDFWLVFGSSAPSFSISRYLTWHLCFFWCRRVSCCCFSKVVFYSATQLNVFGGSCCHASAASCLLFDAIWWYQGLLRHLKLSFAGSEILRIFHILEYLTSLGLICHHFSFSACFQSVLVHFMIQRFSKPTSISNFWCKYPDSSVPRVSSKSNFDFLFRNF